MRAMVANGPGQPLDAEERPRPRCSPGEVLIRVEACGVCRTDLHLIDGELPDARFPVIPGHQVVGRVVEDASSTFARDARVGIPWLGSTCGHCAYCTAEQENLCDDARFTGCHRDGGFAEFVAADARYCLPLDAAAPAVTQAPLLCAGLIGYRALRLSGSHLKRLGLYGFGAAAHLVCAVARQRGIDVFAFTRDGDAKTQAFARSLGCEWAGDASMKPPAALDAAIIFAPAGDLVPAALRAVRKGGRVVCGGIHMSDIPAFPYALLWGERQLRSVANLTRRDGREFLAIAREIDLRPDVTTYALADANRALDDLRHGRFNGAAVLTP